ncbi:MAG: prepilin-type N-terminal cleavage/methylation domain-containing protein [Kiritimatiellae bacterium]|nr:prepilin-type N-terminal cleavage/methylation domain-containing protein [Kiritimatiellia bacterium]
MPGKTKAYRRGFTLLEVNLAVFIMSTGILAICALYSLGFRENRQSVEDVAGAAFAELYLSPLVQGLSATNMPWSAWAEIGDEPSRSATRSQNVADGVWPRSGWRDYVQPIEDTRQLRYRVVGSPRSLADSAWNGVNGKLQSPYRGTKPSIPSDYEYALVVTRRGTIVQLAFRSARRRETLMTQPTYVTEVRFCGNPDK